MHDNDAITQQDNKTLLVDMAGFSADPIYDQLDAKGFIKLFGLPVKVKALVDAKGRR